MIFFAAASVAAKSSRVHGHEYYKNTITAARETIWKAITGGVNGSCATVAVMDEGRLVYSECFGAADRAANRPVDKNTRFNIGSTSKMFGAVAILLLVDEGKVALDEKIVKYIPDFTMKDERYKDITVRMIFNHSSGLPGTTFYFGYETDGGMHKLLLDNLKNASLKHAPGAMSMYCNDGFTLAEIIVERLSGKKFMDFLAERVFKPLGMKNSGPSVGECGSKNIAEYYDLKTGKKYPPEIVEIYACGGISSTPEDLCRFGNSFNPKSSNKLLSAASLAEIRRNQPYRFYRELKHRPMMSEFGWEYSNLDELEAKGFQALGKGGNTLCYSTNLQILPDEGITIALMVNSHASGEALTRPILDALMKDKNLITPPPVTAKKPVEPQKVHEGLLKFAGIYAKDMAPIKVSFNKDNNGIEISPLKPLKPADKEKKSGDKNKAAGKDAPPPAAPPLAYVYNDGLFHDFEKDEKYYFTEIDGRSYFVAHKIKTYGVDMIICQKLDEIKNPVSFKTDITGKAWLVRNEKPYVLAGCIAIGNTDLYAELPGYVNFAGIKKIETPQYASIAGTVFRDQADLSLIDVNGETWIKSNYGLCSPADGARKLMTGINRVVIKSENYNEWLKVEKGAIVNFEKPQKGRIIVVTEEKAIYDSVADKDEIYAPEGSFIFLAGTAGDLFKVNAR
jgi:CubicO group peptidase (beta-lactamase class C family)